MVKKKKKFVNEKKMREAFNFLMTLCGNWKLPWEMSKCLDTAQWIMS